MTNSPTKILPSEEQLLEILRKTIDKSWKIDLDMSSISRWLDNFKGEVLDSKEERNIALWLLCHFTYYNHNDISYLCRILYGKLMHEIAVDNNLSCISEINKERYNMCFSSIGAASESGGMLLYYFRQESGISLNHFFYPTVLTGNSDTILIFLDDVIISGDTAINFYKRNIVANSNLKFKSIYYLSLFATKKAVEDLRNHGILVIACNILNDRDKCFSEMSMIFSRFPDVREIAEKMVRHYGNKLKPEYPLGYKDGQLCMGFEYNTPNNTLPIFWSENNWYPLFPRKEKVYTDEDMLSYNRRFI